MVQPCTWFKHARHSSEHAVMPNPSIEGTSKGWRPWPPLMSNVGRTRSLINSLAVKIKPFTKPILIMKNTIHINFAIFLIIANIIYSSASASTDISLLHLHYLKELKVVFYFTMHPQTLKLLNSIKQSVQRKWHQIQLSRSHYHLWHLMRK